MAAPVLLIPIDAAMTAALATRTALTGNISWKLEIDEGAGYVDRTAYLDDNQLSVAASGSVFKPAEAAQASWRFRNRPKVWSEGDLASAPVKISVKIGASAYIQLFTGYVSEVGCSREKRSAMGDTISVTAYDPARYRGLRRRVPSSSLLNYRVCKNATPATSIAHYLAVAMGLAAGDCDFYDLDYAKDYYGLDGQSKAWSELQDLAAHYGALLHFRYDGKLRLAVWTAAEWNAPAPEYIFDSSNVHNFTAVGGGVFCNRARTEWSQYQALPAGSIAYKNYDNWDAPQSRNAIVVAAGEYWPGGTDALAVGRLGYGLNGEKYPIGIAITTPTLGATSSGNDIEYDGAGLSIVSFNGSTGDTRQNLDSSEIILQNTSGAPLTIRKFQLRGTPVRELKRLRVEHVDAGVANEWEEVEREIPGKAATTEALAKQIVRRYVDFGVTPRKRYQAVVDFTPHLQIGTLVTFNPTADVNLICFVEDYRHGSAGSHSQTRTRVALVERVDVSAVGAGTVNVGFTGGVQQPTSAETGFPASSLSARVWHLNSSALDYNQANPLSFVGTTHYLDTVTEPWQGTHYLDYDHGVPSNPTSIHDGQVFDPNTQAISWIAWIYIETVNTGHNPCLIHRFRRYEGVNSQGIDIVQHDADLELVSDTLGETITMAAALSVGWHLIGFNYDPAGAGPALLFLDNTSATANWGAAWPAFTPDLYRQLAYLYYAPGGAYGTTTIRIDEVLCLVGVAITATLVLDYYTAGLPWAHAACALIPVPSGQSVVTPGPHNNCGPPIR